MRWRYLPLYALGWIAAVVGVACDLFLHSWLYQRAMDRWRDE